MLLIYIRGYVVIIRILKKKNPPLQLDHKSRYTEPLKFSGYFYNTIKAISIESTRFSIVPRAILSKIAIRIDRERGGGGEEREKKKDPLVFSITNLPKGISAKQASAFKCKIHATG